jgi:hypothetical protein
MFGSLACGRASSGSAPVEQNDPDRRWDQRAAAVSCRDWVISQSVESSNSRPPKGSLALTACFLRRAGYL